MAFQYFEYFYKVAQIGNMTKAAHELFVSQPALSKAIHNLEVELGYSLFERSSKGIRLTPSGELLFQCVKNTFSLFDETKNQINILNEEPSFLVRVGVGRDLFEMFLLPHLVTFTKMRPEVRFHLDIKATDLISQSLVREELDIGITPRPLGDNFPFNRSLFPLNSCFIVGEAYKWLIQSPQSIYDVVNHPLIILPKTSMSRTFAENIFSSFGLTIHPTYEMKDTQLISMMVQENMGIGFVTENFVQKDLDAGRIFKVPLTEDFPTTTATLTWRDKSSLSLVAREFVSFLCDICKNSQEFNDDFSF